MMKWSLVLLFVVLCPSSPLPSPQSDDALEYYYDYDPDEPEKKAETTTPPPVGLSGLLGALRDVTNTLFGVLQRKATLISNILEDKKFRKRIGQTLELKSNFTQKVINVAAPLVRETVQQAPSLLAVGRRITSDLLQDKEAREVGGRLIDSAVGLTQRLVSEGPGLIQSGTKLFGGLLRATNKTSPLLIKNVREFGEQIPLVEGFAKAVASSNIGRAQNVADTFQTNLECDLKCGSLSGLNKLSCETEFKCTTDKKTEPV